MRTLFVLFFRELRSLFYTPIAYVMLALFLAFLGVDFWTAVSMLNKQPTESTLLEATFISILFWIVFPLIFPLITMRLFSDEYRMGTIESLVTAPVQDWQIVISKFLGVLVFYVLLLAPTLCFFAIFQSVSGVAPVPTLGMYVSAYLLLFLLGAFFLSIGLFASSLVKDQINAAIISLVMIVLYLFLPSLMGFLLNSTDPRFDKVRQFLNPIDHMREFSQGMVDTRPIVWYVTMTALFLMLTHQVFQGRKLKS